VFNVNSLHATNQVKSIDKLLTLGIGHGRTFRFAQKSKDRKGLLNNERPNITPNKLIYVWH